jgi:hypothetical protein
MPGALRSKFWKRLCNMIIPALIISSETNYIKTKNSYEEIYSIDCTVGIGGIP